jgi:23S rRNA pseudouridine1911/1915/1917 synthase
VSVTDDDYIQGELQDPAAQATPLQWTVDDASDGMRLDRALALALPQYSRSRLQRWIELGAVQVDGALQPPKTKLHYGSVLQVQPQPTEAQQAFMPDDIALDVRYEDEDLLCLHKPAGVVTHPGHGNWRGTLMNGLLFHRASCAQLPRAGIVHRLDKDTSGLMVVAKTERAMNRLVAALAARTVERRYLALVHGRFTKEQVFTGAIARDPRDPTKMAVSTSQVAKQALTTVRPVAQGEGASLVECQLGTGRTHQIRVHLSHAGLHLLGDSVYRAPRPLPVAGLERQALHAWHLAFVHPTSAQRIVTRASPPIDMHQACEALGMGAALSAWLDAQGRGVQ